MKILHISQGYFGSGLYKLLFHSLTELGIENKIYIPQNEIHNSQLDDNIILSENSYNFIERFLFFGKQNKSFKEIETKVDLSQIEIIHAHNLFSGGYVAYKISKKFNIPYVVSIRNTDVNFFYKYMIHLRRIGHKVWDSASQIIFISPAYKSFILKHWYSHTSVDQKYNVIPNGLDPYFLGNLNFSKKIENSNLIRLIYFGEISKNKNLETVAKACLKLINGGYQVQFDIVGEIGYREFYNLSNKYSFIHYHNRCPKEELITHIRKSDIFVMPSINETFGLVYTEALSQGLPIIYTKGQGFDGFFEQGEVGFSVNAFDYKSIARYILEIYTDYEKISKRCVAGAKKFEWQIIAKKYLELYQQIRNQ